MFKENFLKKKFAQIKKLFEHKNNVSPQKNIVLI